MDIEYIEPKDIGQIELGRREEFAINPERSIKSAIIAIIYIIIFALLIYGYFCDNTNVLSLDCTVAAAIHIGLGFSNQKKPKITASAYGTVVEKEPIVQQIVPRKKYVYKKYSPSPPDTDKETVEQIFYYLTLKLANGKYVRYVNCSEKDYLNINIGDSVLAVCYDLNDIRGYLTE